MLLVCVSVGLLSAVQPAYASFTQTVKEGYNTLSDNVAETWQAPQNYDLYVPAITWHARFAY
ncbi:MAG: lipid IV(A) palmitoyltransferase PagP, partial [Kluyvera intermedia]